jgi:hypothetical protein
VVLLLGKPGRGRPQLGERDRQGAWAAAPGRGRFEPDIYADTPIRAEDIYHTSTCNSSDEEREVETLGLEEIFAQDRCRC